MKKILLAIVAVALVGMAVSKAEAGRWGYGRPAVAYGWVRPLGPVVVAPRYYRPAYVARPLYYAPYAAPYGYGYAPWRTGVVVQQDYYGGGGVIVRTPGFGLNIRY
jgi:hypothetical protein